MAASIYKPFAQPAFEKVRYVKNVPLLNQCPLFKDDLELYSLSQLNGKLEVFKLRRAHRTVFWD
jgi:hypothetical protein